MLEWSPCPDPGPCSSKDLLLLPGSPCSRSERQLLLYPAEALAGGPLAVLGLDVAPSTLLPSYDPDTSLVLLTGKVGWGASRGDGWGRGGEEGSFSWLPRSHQPPTQGDTRVFLYELLPEAPFFLECNSFTSTDPHKVSLWASGSSPICGTQGSPALSRSDGEVQRPVGSAGHWARVCPAALRSWLLNSTIIRN